MSNAHIRSNGIDVLAKGKLPIRIASSIRKAKFTVEDLIQWEKSKPVVWFDIADGKLTFEFRACLSLKKWLAILGGTIGVVLTIVQKLPEIQEIIRKVLAP